MVQPVFLIRDPIREFSSWKSAGWQDIDSLIHGYISLFQVLEQTSSHAVSCLLYEKLVENPQVEIQHICEEWQVPFSEAMLKGPLGLSFFSADGEDVKLCGDEAAGPFATLEANSFIAPKVETHGLLSNDEKEILEKSIGRQYLCCWKDDVVRLRTIFSEKTWIGFDLDDTLHEFRRASSKAIDCILTSISAQYGTPMSRLREQYSRILKAKTASAFSDGRSSFDYRRERFTLLLTYFSLPQTTEFLDALLESYETALVGAHELKCGAIGLLSTIKGMGKKIVVITEGPQDGQERTVNALGIRNYIDFLATTNHFRVSKVDGLFRKVLQHLGISSDEIAYVGDSEERDMEPAIAEGIFSIHLAEAKNISLSSSPPRVNTLRKLQYIMSEKA
ncbi:Haloacid dehalogenase-like hydrolase [Cordyceps fumosorosea ARSEF 2679]|uniref:Haloacid dehalogenase-like hydrolase n=1 Tax=Cordyceps fumosorosea (strain ARSEF 2679) TaxID=1081104 RepID=A0A167T2H7_CORFA|nr:Haloacid dehalogenase-like hydrolase [Cordyceps fumosorosea ARSEF 2679]OAA60177.1 Haloacid dehalogenase-like hydrolase [Cordyceps fumosorosea ARSEF 2679]